MKLFLDEEFEKKLQEARNEERSRIIEELQKYNFSGVVVKEYVDKDPIGVHIRVEKLAEAIVNQIIKIICLTSKSEVK